MALSTATSEPKAEWPKWAAAPLVALVSLYFATRYAAIDDRTARSALIASTLVLAILSVGRYLRIRKNPNWLLLSVCAVALLITAIGRWFEIPPFSGWRDAIIACLITIATLYFSLTYRKRQTDETMTRPSRIALLTLTALAPGLVHGANNMSFLPGLTVVPFLAALMGYGLVAYLLVLATAPSFVSKTTLTLITASFILALIFLPSIRGMMRIDGAYQFDFFLFFGLVTWLVWFIARLSLRFLITSLGIFATMQVFTIAQSAMTDVDATLTNLQPKVLKQVAGMVPVDTPNIYLFVYDGIPEFEMLQALGFDSTAHQNLFEEYGFKRYAGSHSLASASLESMARSLDMHGQLAWKQPLSGATRDQRLGFYRQVRGGNSITHHLLRHLGYTSYGILPAYLLGKVHQLDHVLPEETHRDLELSFTLFRGIMQGEFRSDTKGWGVLRRSEHDVQEKFHVITEGVPKRFVDSHILLPGHSPNSGRCRANERGWWHERYLSALELMESDFDALRKHDPTAIVIAMSDHGPDLTGEYCIELGGYKMEEIDRLAILDRYSTMIAIRWPESERAARYDQDLVLNQDILPTVFAYLYDSPIPLSWKVPREVSWKGHVFLRDGKFIQYRSEK